MKKGFTLIEVLISMTLAVLVLGSAFWAMGSSLRTWKSGAANLEALQGGRIVLERIMDEVRNARGIDPSSTSQKIVLNYEDYNITYELKNGKVRRDKGEGASYLTTEGIVNSLNFIYLSSKLVEIEMDVLKRKIFSKAFVRN